MKTLEQKIDDLIGQIIDCDLRSKIGMDKAKKAVRLALKEQDRDTRHACADIMSCYEDLNACMNCREGLYP